MSEVLGISLLSSVSFLSIPNNSEMLAPLLDNKESLEFISTFMEDARP